MARFVTDVPTHGTRKHGNGGRRIEQVISKNGYCLPCDSHDPSHPVTYVRASLFDPKVRAEREANPMLKIRCKACQKRIDEAAEQSRLASERQRKYDEKVAQQLRAKLAKPTKKP